MDEVESQKELVTTDIDKKIWCILKEMQQATSTNPTTYLSTDDMASLYNDRIARHCKSSEDFAHQDQMYVKPANLPIPFYSLYWNCQYIGYHMGS